MRQAARSRHIDDDDTEVRTAPQWLAEVTSGQTTRGRWLGACLLAGWLIALLVGFWFLVRYETTPGVAGSPPEAWPRRVEPWLHPQLVSRGDEPIVLMFLHPQCPCSRSSVAELRRIIATLDHPVRLVAVVYRPEHAPADWEDTLVSRAVAESPHIWIVTDHGAQLAQAFGVKTSGHTLVYDNHGKLQFSGGITPGRGHQGDNAGEAAVRTILAGGTPQRSSSLVFGCAIVPE